MSFLKIRDPVKRDQTVEEYLELRKNIRDNLLSERTGEQQLQTELKKFYRPITETQKATAREITEGLKPIREGIEKLPQAMLPIGEASGEAPEEYVEEDEELVGKIAYEFLNKPFRDKTFGIHKEGGRHYIGNQHVIIKDNDIILTKNGERFKGTPGLWELITSKNPKNFTDKDYGEYKGVMILTNALHRNNDPNNPYPIGSGSNKWMTLLRPIWHRGEFAGKGIIMMPSDPNALLERLDLLLASQEAGHTGVGNELVSICDELKRQGNLDAEAYKKLNSIIKKMIVPKHGFKKRYAYGGSGIFDTMVNFLTRMFTSNAAKQIASSSLDVGKSVAKEGAKKALEAGKSAAVDVGKKLVTKALTPKSKKFLQKHTEPATQNISTLIDGSAIEIQELVKKLNGGSGIKIA